LYLIARMRVEKVTNRRGAERLLGWPVGFADRTDHCVCGEEYGSPILFGRRLPMNVVRKLRFETQTGKVSGVALKPGGGVKPQAMRSIRRLTSASRDMLNALVDSENGPELRDILRQREPSRSTPTVSAKRVRRKAMAQPPPDYPSGLIAIEKHFHAVIMDRAGEHIRQRNLELPKLDVLIAAPETEGWFPVPGMYGGFKYRLERNGADLKLICESWCRVVDGSGQRHQITSEGRGLGGGGFCLMARVSKEASCLPHGSG
jgi:hypothetical protein